MNQDYSSVFMMAVTSIGKTKFLCTVQNKETQYRHSLFFACQVYSCRAKCHLQSVALSVILARVQHKYFSSLLLQLSENFCLVL